MTNFFAWYVLTIHNIVIQLKVAVLMVVMVSSGTQSVMAWMEKHLLLSLLLPLEKPRKKAGAICKEEGAHYVDGTKPS
eukprot:scaffold26474_cov156-Skeletonema_marinoi.AAC.3